MSIGFEVILLYWLFWVVCFLGFGIEIFWFMYNFRGCFGFFRFEGFCLYRI